MSTLPLFSGLELAPADPILGVIEAFNADTRPTKVNLGVGVYLGEDGKIPVLECVRAAESALVQKVAPRGYLPIDGIDAYCKGVQSLLFGPGTPLATSGQVVIAQALGGTGGLRLGAEMLRKASPTSTVLLSDPSWENHRAVFEAAGFAVETYPYYDPVTRGLDFAGMRAALSAARARSIVILHACCHNPTGVDPTGEQWAEIVRIVRERDLVPFLDLAYQGFGDGLEADRAVVDLFAASGLSFLVASSFSKSFSLYGERVGALSLVTHDADEAKRVRSQLKRVIRSNYSTPATHGGALVAAVLSDPALRAKWQSELESMRLRIRSMREALAARLSARLPGHDFGYVLRQRGMFSYSGLSAPQVERLRAESGIYAISSGRICVAAINSRNVDAVASAIAAVMQG